MRLDGLLGQYRVLEKITEADVCFGRIRLFAAIIIVATAAGGGLVVVGMIVDRIDQCHWERNVGLGPDVLALTALELTNQIQRKIVGDEGGGVVGIVPDQGVRLAMQLVQQETQPLLGELAKVCLLFQGFVICFQK